jgi:hypothetical protein
VTLVEYDSPNKCGVSAPGTVDGLQSGGILTTEEGRNMVRQIDDYGRAKAERLLKKLEEKDSKMRKKWVDAATKIARAWRKEDKLKPFYVVDSYGKERELVRC